VQLGYQVGRAEPTILLRVVRVAKELPMRKTIIGAVALTAMVIASTANAAVRERTVTGAAIGAGTGAVIAGPPGAIVGGVAGAVIGGPRLSRNSRTCWINRNGNRVCRYRR
jgi:osmotically inducible lipoprotein OsmB